MAKEENDSLHLLYRALREVIIESAQKERLRNMAITQKHLERITEIEIELKMKELELRYSCD